MPEPAFTCVGYTAKDVGFNINCGNCKSWGILGCNAKELLNELYAESLRFKAIDRMMRGNRGVRTDA